MNLEEAKNLVENMLEKYSKIFSANELLMWTDGLIEGLVQSGILEFKELDVGLLRQHRVRTIQQKKPGEFL